MNLMPSGHLLAGRARTDGRAWGARPFPFSVAAVAERGGGRLARLPPREHCPEMLADFVNANRSAIIAAARARVASRPSPKPSAEELQNGVPVFLRQLVDALYIAQSTDTPPTRAVSQDTGAEAVTAHEAIASSATRHGNDLFQMGLTIAQVVHDYGDVCQAITALAVEQRARIQESEFQTLNLCLDEAIAGAVTEYARQRERAMTDEQTERLGMVAHELRNVLNTAMLSFDMIKSGRVAVGGSTALLHGKSLIALRDLIDRSLTEVRLDAGLKNIEHIRVADFIEEVEIGALLQGQVRGVHLTVAPMDRTLGVDGDRPLLASVVSNLLQNAFKFTPKGGNVCLATRSDAEHVFIDVEDECGGLPPGKAAELFRPFGQRSSDRTGMGLGLSICQRAAAANAGAVHVRDVPGKGCVFTLELPRTEPWPVSGPTNAS